MSKQKEETRMKRLLKEIKKVKAQGYIHPLGFSLSPAKTDEVIELTDAERRLVESSTIYLDERKNDELSEYLDGVILVLVAYGHGKILPDGHYWYTDDNKTIYCKKEE